MIRRSRRILAAAICAAVSASMVGGSAQAIEGGRVWYTYGKGTNCGAKSQVDPINVVFYGRDATAGRTDAFVARYMHWGDATDSSTQGFLTPRCRLAAHQRADGSTEETRFHVRLRQRDRKKGERRRFTVGDAHHEDHVGSVTNPFTGCGPGGGHAVDKGDAENPTPEGSGFDQGRRRMSSRWRARGRSVKFRFKGNTHSFKQCDGDPAASNGRVAYMTIPKKKRR